MKLPVTFPSEREKLAREVAEYRNASSEERLQALFDLSLFCEPLLAASVNRERQLCLLEENEKLEHRRWIELLANHDRRQRTGGPL